MYQNGDMIFQIRLILLVIIGLLNISYIRKSSKNIISFIFNFESLLYNMDVATPTIGIKYTANLKGQNNHYLTKKRELLQMYDANRN